MNMTSEQWAMTGQDKCSRFHTSSVCVGCVRAEGTSQSKISIQSGIKHLEMGDIIIPTLWEI